MENQVKEKKRIKKWPIVLAVILLLIAAAVIFMLTRPAQPAGNIITLPVERGSISTNVVGTGNLENLEAEKSETYAALEYDEILVEIGDAVKPGDVIAAVNGKSVTDRIAAVQQEIDSLDAAINASSSGFTEKAVSSYVEGRIKKIYAAEGDDVKAIMAEQSALLVISMNGEMAVDFESSEVLQPEDYVEVVTADGTVKDGEIVAAKAGNFTATFDDYEVTENESVTVRKSDDTVLGAGEAYIYEPIEITAVEGRVDEIYVDVEDYIYSGSSLLYLTEIPNSGDYNELTENRSKLTEELNYLIRLSESNELTADFDGEIASINIAEKDETVQQTAKSNTSAVSADNENKITGLTYFPPAKMRLAINIDELDILNVSLGQQAAIAFDAIEGKEYEGTISELDKSGTVTNGGAKYRAVIELDKTEEMRAGMNATATITIEERENVLLIPIIAIVEHDNSAYVYTETNADGALAGEREITTGLSDGENVEITDGLSEGDVIYYMGEDTGFFGNFPMGAGAFRRANAGTMVTVTTDGTAGNEE